MMSVAKPDIHFEPKETRLGQWYYGIGQELADRPSFQAIEEPHRKMHEIGAELLNSELGDSNEMILAFNESFETVNKCLHLLEAELMAEENLKLLEEPG